MQDGPTGQDGATGKGGKPDAAVGDGPGLLLDAAGAESAAPAKSPGAYQVLARKYRPSSFDDLIGQDVLVRTLTNAFELDRIHQAYLLTGVRGVGKTTTARILARAFNYQVPAKDGQPAIDRPTIDMPELGVHCQAIIESRHVDVIEMDAASHTGVDDVREIIESVRYRPVMARCKVYIIDEVHMLSKNAFNALLKTLEEPPEHVRFIFATTESEKIPITVRSRCQRFDLRRVDSSLIVKHLATLCEKESVAADQEALAHIARAAEGSVRDSLSLLDQAIAHSTTEGAGSSITGEQITKMLGAGTRSRIVDLFEAVMKGDPAEALATYKDEYDRGADPLLLLHNLAEYVHFVTRLKVAPGPADDVAISQEERERGQAFAKDLSIQALTMAWQIISKGISDVKDSPRQLAAGEMVLVRLAYASGLPSPEDVLRKLQTMPAGADAGAQPAAGGNAGPAGGGGARARAVGGGAAAIAAPVAPASTPRMQLAPAPEPSRRPQQQTEPGQRVQIRQFEDIVALAHMRRDIQLKMALERDVRLVHFEQGKIEFSLVEGASSAIAQQLMRRLDEWTGERWQIINSSETGAPSLKEQSDAREQARLVGVRADPLVRSVMEQFPGAEIVAVRTQDDNLPAAGLTAGPDNDTASDEVAFEDQFSTGDEDGD